MTDVSQPMTDVIMPNENEMYTYSFGTFYHSIMLVSILFIEVCYLSRFFNRVDRLIESVHNVITFDQTTRTHKNYFKED